ncbi:MAG: BlaI/MecI/CopY family transcriptional regulator [Pseudomonadales bacterium]|nr:BlaI/MecI/CopY family transcriptional regulator [Pseudomonadales bacterium]
MGNKKTELLTQTELEFMKLIWGLGETTVRQVRNAMVKADDVPYTTVAAVIRLLAKKGFLDSRMVGKTLHYSPAVSRAEYESKAITQIVEKLFDGAPADLATRLIDDHDFSPDELKVIHTELSKKIKEFENRD